MSVLSKSRRLSKELGLLDVYAVATGATLSSGFFLLPSLAATTAGPGLILSYLIAAAAMVPAVFCMAELATAMPRAGGAYYFVDRSLGPLAGTIGGVGTWLALVLKAAFALVGMGAYLTLFVDDRSTTLVAAGFALFFGALNLFSTRHTGRAQLILVALVLMILGWFIAYGWGALEVEHFGGFLDAGGDAIFSTAGLVYISYVGITKVASISEEVKDPERNLPLAIFLALGTAVVVYSLGTVVMVGVIGAEALSESLTPVARVAENLGGERGAIAVSVAAMLAFASVANAAIMSASRYPLAMSRDHLVPRVFAQLRGGIPTISVIVTVSVILLFLFLFNVTQIAKLASAFQLLVFACIALAVIVMRESGIESYDPGYRSPAYPWLPLLGMGAPLWLIAEMGWLPILFAFVLTGFGMAWYFYYARLRVARHGAIYHVFERLGRQRYAGLDRELRGILKEKGLREGDPFEEVIARASVVDMEKKASFDEVVDKAAALLAQRLPCSAELLAEGFLNGTRTGATPVAHGTALPHLRLAGATRAEIVLVRCAAGVQLDIGDVFGGPQISDSVFALFFLISPEEDPGQHLRLLAQLAGRVDEDDFLTRWLEARDPAQLAEVLLRDECYLSVTIRPGSPAHGWRGHALRDLSFPEGSLVALIHRGGAPIVPSGASVLRESDRLTIIGSRDGIEKLRAELEKKGTGLSRDAATR